MKLSNKYYMFVLAFLLGISWAFAMRFILVERDITHYHANFAVYVDGVRDEMDNFTFYEEVSSCSPEYATQPESRLHLHDNEPTVLHVHDVATTWGHFFSNIDYSITNDILQTRTDIYIDGDDGRELRYILNGSSVSNISNRVIGDEDVLLVDYSSDSEEELMNRHASIPRDAGEYNEKDDPASCQGSGNESFTNRFKRTLGIE